MNYPLISEYIEAIKSAEDNFMELSYLRPVLGDDGMPVMTSGNFAVVFKMKVEQSGKFYAVKCFTKEQEGRAENYKKITEYLDLTSRYLVSVKYYDDELFVDSLVTDTNTFPVLLMEWVEGKTLDKYIGDNLQWEYKLQYLAYSFSEMSVWLKSMPFAHGDLKPDNIIVTDDDSNMNIRLVDYDGMFVPSMKGHKAKEIGSPHFRHPLRNVDDFDENIDDFPMISILLSLTIISKYPELYKKYAAQDRLLFSDADYMDIWESKIIKDITRIDDNDINKLVGLLILALADKKVVMINPILMRLYVPPLSEIGCHPPYTYDAPYTDYKGELWNSLWKDQYGARYSYDRKKIIMGANIKKYYIRDGVFEIAPCAFGDIGDTGSAYDISLSLYTGDISYGKGFDLLEEVILPKTIKKIGYYAFHGSHIKIIHMPSSIISIGENAFESCKYLINVEISSSVQSINDYTFSNCQSLTYISIPHSVKFIGRFAFKGCINLKTVILPYKSFFGKDPFDGCVSLKKIIVPQGRKEWYFRFLPLQLREYVREIVI